MLAGLARPGLGLGELCAFLPLGEHRDGLTAIDVTAVVEIEPDQPLGDRRRERHLLIGVGGADRLNSIGEAHRCDRLGLDRGCGAFALLFLAAACREQPEQRDKEEPTMAML